ncbi:MAG: TonB-dependent receptor [Bacteroidetes bacterium]|nr:MAG: TonB-dependent receptor [Bacteroidota bacterium]
MKKRSLLFTMMVLAMAVTSFAQGVIQGVVMDANTNETLIGATVVVEGTTFGVTTNLDGSFLLVAPAGDIKLDITYVGYESKEMDITVKDGSTYNVGNILLKSSAIGLDEVNVMASVAVDRKTPVAVSTLDAQTIQNQLGSQEFPEVMKNTPNVYATKTGGGFGDARVNVRGFDQKNVAVMINGIPVNDMENGWVYWSNWAGLGDATRTIQIQRGLGASKLAINSVGGTINIITKTSSMNKGGSFQVGATDYGRFKSMLTLSTGELKSGTAITFVGSRTFGSGYIDATWVDAWSYFLSVSQKIGDNHQLVFTVIGAPQQHGQRDGYYMLDSAKFNKYGPRYTQNWGYRGGEVLNERVNFYHKPQMALNWYWTINEKAFLSTSAYYSFGNGGGSGPLGMSPYKYEPPQTASGYYDWDALAEYNANNIDSTISETESRSAHIIRNSMNNHQWMGILSTLNYNFSDALVLTAGLDARHYKGEHYREVRDLVGGDYWYDSKFGMTKVGDKIAYWNDGIVTYGGLFAQLEYTKGIFNAFAAATVSNTWTKRIDYRTYLPDNDAAESDVLSNLGYNFKVGANFNITETSNIFVNGGFYSRVPFFRFMFLNYRNDVNPDLTNEKITAAEVGYAFNGKKLKIRANGYYTIWNDISLLTGFVAEDGSYVNAFMSSLQEIHSGIELEATYIAARWLRLGGMANFGNWKYADDATAKLYDDQTHELIGEGIIYTKDLKVGNQPQNSFGVNGTFKIAKTIDIGFNYLYYTQLYAQFKPETRKDPDVRAQAFQLPNYGMLDMRLGWKFKLAGLDSYFNWNIYNVTDNVALVEAEDKYNSDRGEYAFKKGFWSWGRNMNFSLKVRF